MIFNRFIQILLMILFSSVASAAGLVFRCDRVFVKPQFQYQIEEWGVQANHVEITGEKDYELKSIRESLKISDQWIAKRKQDQKSILSIAEGTSGLLPFLSHEGLNVYATDLWYLQPKPKHESLKPQIQFEKKWKNQIFPSDVRKLPLANESVDTILSHKLYNNLHMGDTLSSLVEISRVLSLGGQARLADISATAFQHIEKYLNENLSGIVIWKHEGSLLQIKKVLPMPNREYRIPYDSRFRYRGIPNGTQTFDLPWAPGQEL